MCCFRLHFSDFNMLLFQKLLKKITCYAKREKKITCHEQKSQPPPPPRRISNGPSLRVIIHRTDPDECIQYETRPIARKRYPKLLWSYHSITGIQYVVHTTIQYNIVLINEMITYPDSSEVKIFIIGIGKLHF